MVLYIFLHLLSYFIRGRPVHDESDLRFHAHCAVEDEYRGTVFQMILLIIRGHVYVRGRRLSRGS
jgi:hypothetical protein